MEHMKLARATSAFTPFGSSPYFGDSPYPGGSPYAIGDQINPGVVRGLWDGNMVTGMPRSYHHELKQCRYFYRYDPIASTVINRMADMAVSEIRSRRQGCSDEEMTYFNAVAKMLSPVLEACALEYLVAGMAIPDYSTTRLMGSRVSPDLGRTRYVFPANFWVRNPDNITLRRVPTSMRRAVFLQVPTEEIYFISHNGVFSDGTEDIAAYQSLVNEYPEYVQMVKSGQTLIALPDSIPILRKAMSNMDYPQPFLVPALQSLKHKLRIKQVDYSIATRALEAIRLIKAGNDTFPVVEDDPLLENIKSQMSAQSIMTGELVYSLLTNHTVTIEWVYPPLDALLSDQKYAEPNADIFMAMGFSRVLLVGESLRSNSSQSVASTLGPVATLNELRRGLLSWVRELYKDLANRNGFKNIPEPVFQPIPTGDIATLVQIAIDAAKVNIISKDTVARLFNSDFETEHEQIAAETAASGDKSLLDLTLQTPLELQQKQQDNQQELQQKQLDQQDKQLQQQKDNPQAPTGGGGSGNTN